MQSLHGLLGVDTKGRIGTTGESRAVVCPAVGDLHLMGFELVCHYSAAHLCLDAP